MEGDRDIDPFQILFYYVDCRRVHLSYFFFAPVYLTSVGGASNKQISSCITIKGAGIKNENGMGHVVHILEYAGGKSVKIFHSLVPTYIICEGTANRIHDCT